MTETKATDEAQVIRALVDEIGPDYPEVDDSLVYRFTPIIRAYGEACRRSALREVPCIAGWMLDATCFNVEVEGVRGAWPREQYCDRCRLLAEAETGAQGA